MKLNDLPPSTPRMTRLARALHPLLPGLALLLGGAAAGAQGLTLANPDWNITLSDFGYSDFLLDNTPGFEGREYLSGEWGAAVAYQPAGAALLAPRFLDPLFLFPDWPTLSTFGVRTPLAQTGLNADNLPIAQSVITNRDLEITLRHEMIDTVVGIPMGITPASATGSNAPLSSGRYVLRQTATLRNVSGGALGQVQFFQLLHGLHSQRGVFDNRAHAGPWSTFQYDVTLAGVDAGAVGPGSSGAGLEDFIAFHAAIAPSAFEIGQYGIEGNGVDDHALGKPSAGVHLSIEDNWQSAPYSTFQGRDEFAPASRWVAGAQRWSLGNLAAGQSVSLEVLLSIRTGTRVPAGTIVSGGCNGGSGVPGGLDYEFEEVSADGSCFGDYSSADETEVALRVQQGEFGPLTFLTPGGPAQLWKVEFSGAYAGAVRLVFGYDPLLLPPGFDEATLCVHEYVDGDWQPLAGQVDPVTHSIAVTVNRLSTFALGVEALIAHTVTATTAPANSGTITGAGPYADGASATLVAAATPGYAFSNWTEGGLAVSMSPSFTWRVTADRALVANFVPVGAAQAISTRSQPSNGGSTSGDGAYASGASATVHATANPGYKFSKWLVNGVAVSTASDYTFTVTGDRELVAKFKPVFSMVVSADPPDGGEVEADPIYEAGELAKLKAKPNAGWAFVHWTQNGLPVSTATNYQFNVTASRELVGHFARGHRIDASAEPPQAGTVSGAGVWGDGQPVFLEAVAQPGYVFVNWTEGVVAVSESAAYSFPSDAGRVLVANFVAQPALAAASASPGFITLSWPAGAAGWVLQENPELAGNGWVDSTRPVTVNGDRKEVTVSTAGGFGFFRLVRH